MGLDMYLSRSYSKYRKDDGTFSTNWDDYKIDMYGRSNRVTFTEMVGYWRKANHIHKWFVDNVQEGEDDCKEYYVSIEKLHELRDTCFDILSKLHGTEIRVPKKDVEDFKEANTKFYGSSKIQRIIIDANNLETVKSLTGYHTLTKPQIMKCDCRTKLPTQEGFFFGSRDYDGWYLISLVNTIEMLDELFQKHEWNDKKREEDKKNNTSTATYFDYYYQASW
jgi:hypothetical protein